jgi:hypothetical protein
MLHVGALAWALAQAAAPMCPRHVTLLLLAAGPGVGVAPQQEAGAAGALSSSTQALAAPHRATTAS